MRNIQAIGRGYSGSSSVLTSLANAEVLAHLEDEAGYYNFCLQVFNDASISINGSALIFIAANTTFETDSNDAPIISLKFAESGVQFTWTGAY